MKNYIKAVVVSAAVAVAGISGGTPAGAATHAVPVWALVRVDFSSRGDLEGVRLRYGSGDRSFERTALEAASKAAFVPATRAAGSRASDYLLTTDGRRLRARIVPTLTGYRTETPADARIPAGRDTWTLASIDSSRQCRP